MAIRFRCDACGQELETPEGLAGRMCRCHSCGNTVRVPEPARPAAEVPEHGGLTPPVQASVPAAETQPAPEVEVPSTRSGMPQQLAEDPFFYIEGYKLLGEETRLQILLTLATGPRNVTSLCEGLGLRQPTVSHHLGLLRKGRMVVSQRRGKSVVYDIDRPQVRRLLELMERLT